MRDTTSHIRRRARLPRYHLTAVSYRLLSFFFAAMLRPHFDHMSRSSGTKKLTWTMWVQSMRVSAALRVAGARVAGARATWMLERWCRPRLLSFFLLFFWSRGLVPYATCQHCFYGFAPFASRYLVRFQLTRYKLTVTWVLLTRILAHPCRGLASTVEIPHRPARSHCPSLDLR